MIRKAVILACAALLAALLAACAGSIDRSGVADRMYVIQCGENHVKDLSRWTPGSNVGKPFVFSDYCYLVRHGDDWFLWDTGNSDKFASLPNGFSAGPNAPVTAFMKKPLVDSLKEIGVRPADIRHLAMSHSHGDHSGNANLFTKALVYMQITEYEAIFGADAKKYNLPAANFEFLHTPGELAAVRKLTGDLDVFGDGSVVIKSTPGHTPGHQSLFVKLRRTGPVLLTGDLAHLYSNWEGDIVPGFNYSVEETRQSLKEMKAFVARTGAKVMVNHDPDQSRLVVKSPMFLD